MLNKNTILTTIFTIVDDAIKASNYFNQKRPGPDPELSDAEIITLALYQEFISEPREKQFIRVHGDVIKQFFPKLIERSRYNRRKKDLWRIILAVRISLLISLKAQTDTVVLDSAPVPCVGYKRPKKSTKFTDADYGYCSSKAMKYFGYKFHNLVSLTGIVIDFMLSSARPHDREAVVELLGEQKEILKQVFGDKGYNDTELQNYVLENLGMDFWAPRKKNQAQVESKQTVKNKNKIRLVVERVNSQLQEQFTLSKHYAKSQLGIFTRVAAKITAHTLGILINRLFGRPSLALADLAV